jgi:VCBS repeat-containing protein
VLASALTTSVSTDITGFKGSVDVTFSAADKNFDFLAAGETLTIVYNVTVTDSSGNSVTQPVAITVTGSNDAPVLAADASGPQRRTARVRVPARLPSPSARPLPSISSPPGRSLPSLIM